MCYDRTVTIPGDGYHPTDMKIVPLGPSGTVFTSYRFFTSAHIFGLKSYSGKVHMQPIPLLTLINVASLIEDVS